MPKNNFDANEIIAWSAQLPLVHVDRDAYLRSQFDRYCSPDLLEKVLALGPVEAGIPKKTIELVAKSAISHETAMVTLISTAAGIPGGFAMIGTIPGDIIQFHGAMIRISQKLAYIHGWPELFEDNGKNIDDDTRGLMLVFLGVMYGVAGAARALEKIAAHVAAETTKKLVTSALTKGAVYPVIKKIAKAVGITMTKRLLASGVGKAIPVVGGVISGAITFASFHPMAKKLNNHLLKRTTAKRRALKK
ncbi:MAG: hypothetical protein F2587_01665 [Actinobacteria bacterium]|uniref:Unannotated protein n=1 Tax=freshwater metagenome TaxID=449393 RepID=A0A6J6GT12_9ZZZZ|nr:hypothetical protein [Actinomycetota bacterium]